MVDPGVQSSGHGQIDGPWISIDISSTRRPKRYQKSAIINSQMICSIKTCMKPSSDMVLGLSIAMFDYWRLNKNKQKQTYTIHHNLQQANTKITSGIIQHQ